MKFSHILSFSEYLFRVSHGPGLNRTAEIPALETLPGWWEKSANQQVATSDSYDLFSRKGHFLHKAQFTNEMIQNITWKHFSLTILTSIFLKTSLTVLASFLLLFDLQVRDESSVSQINPFHRVNCILKIQV